MLSLHIALTAVASSLANLVPPGVNCNGRIPRFATGEYIFHQNETAVLKLTTQVDLKLELGHRSCFQVDIDTENGTDRVSSIFYVFGYKDFYQGYPIMGGYKFGIPEVRSYCKCDCPKSDSFCNENYNRKFCSKGEVCVQRFHANQPSYGCQHDGAAKLCCEIAVKAYGDRRFRAVLFGLPTSQAVLQIDIFVFVGEEWVLFRDYTRTIYPSGGNRLELNGFENVADLDIIAQAPDPKFQLFHDHKHYFYYEERAAFDLLLTPVKSGQITDQNYNFLVFENGRWNVHDAQINLHAIHNPSVTNCLAQKYTDQYSNNVAALVVRNSSGSINYDPAPGQSIKELYHAYVKDISLSEDGEDVRLTHSAGSAPLLSLDMNLEQRLSVMAHIHLSYLKGFEARICLDKNLNRFLNITLVNAHGSFRIEIFKGPGPKNLDLTVPVVTRLPIASNYTEILPLPNHVKAERYICVFAERSSKRKHCKYADYIAEPVQWYYLPNTFLETEGSCPGCNELTEQASFFSYLNPRTWFNGIGSVSEGLALAVEVAFYVLIALLAFGILRRIVWPLVRWALCPVGGTPRYQKTKDEVPV